MERLHHEKQFSSRHALLQIRALESADCLSAFFHLWSAASLLQVEQAVSSNAVERPNNTEQMLRIFVFMCPFSMLRGGHKKFLCLVCDPYAPIRNSVSFLRRQILTFGRKSASYAARQNPPAWSKLSVAKILRALDHQAESHNARTTARRRPVAVSLFRSRRTAFPGRSN
jgi:hypothetical protein